VHVGHAALAVEDPRAVELDLLGTEVVEETPPLSEEHRHHVELELVEYAGGERELRSPPQPPAGSNVPRPATTAPVGMNSPTTRPFTPPRSEMSLWLESAPGSAHSCSRWPPSPSPLSGRSLGPAMNPSSDVDM
jgi:hypothetical protein